MGNAADPGAARTEHGLAFQQLRGCRILKVAFPDLPAVCKIAPGGSLLLNEGVLIRRHRLGCKLTPDPVRFPAHIDTHAAFRCGTGSLDASQTGTDDGNIKRTYFHADLHEGTETACRGFPVPAPYTLTLLYSSGPGVARDMNSRGAYMPRGCNTFPYLFPYQSHSCRTLDSSSKFRGLAMCPFMPACIAFCRSSSKALAVMAMMGMVLASALSMLRICRAAS